MQSLKKIIRQQKQIKTTTDFDSNKAKTPWKFDRIKSIIKYQTTDGVLNTNKAQESSKRVGRK